MTKMPVKIIFGNSNFKNPSVEQLLREAGHLDGVYLLILNSF